MDVDVDVRATAFGGVLAVAVILLFYREDLSNVFPLARNLVWLPLIQLVVHRVLDRLLNAQHLTGQKRWIRLIRESNRLLALTACGFLGSAVLIAAVSA